MLKADERVITEYNNDIVLKICHDGTANKLALLKCKLDCTLFIEVRDLENGSINTINLGSDYFNLNALYDHFPSHLAKRQFEPTDIHPIYQPIFESKDNKRYFNIINWVFSFDADFKNGLFLLETTYEKYSVFKSEDLQRPVRRSDFRVFGKLNINITSTVLDKHKTGHVSLYNGVKFFDDNLIVDLTTSSGGDPGLRIWNFKMGYFYQLNLKNNDLIQGDEYPCEYIHYKAINKKETLFGFIYYSVTYGVEGIRVLKIDDLNKLKLIYSMDELNDGHAIHFIDFNFNGDEFAVLNKIRVEHRYPHHICLFSIQEKAIKKNSILTSLKISSGKLLISDIVQLI